MNARRMVWQSLALVGVMVGVSGCFDSHGRGECYCPPGAHCLPCADADGGPLSGDAGGAVCGATTCRAGERCCSDSCDSVCVPVGTPCGICPHPTPANPDAGTVVPCGGLAGLTCGPNEFCDYPDGSFCGGDDTQGVCRPRPDGCPVQDCAPVCGCDGSTYCSACAAHAAGTDVTSACTGDADAGAGGDAGDCGAMDARSTGQCAGVVGWAWDGSECVGIGCACEGADCDRLFESQVACQSAEGHCVDDCRTTGCPDGSSCQLCWASYACVPTGAVC